MASEALEDSNVGLRCLRGCGLVTCIDSLQLEGAGLSAGGCIMLSVSGAAGLHLGL